MKYKYKGKEGIAALRLKRIDEKRLAELKKTHQQKRGIVSRLVGEMRLPGKTRRDQRMQAKVFLKDPLHYNTHNIGRQLTKRGKFLS
jgi:hypothetical protein